ncbi:hypothetical protein GLA29479_320 [Lysobacter antibioticus]|nr:hypothetical protein GLA29479_320 [Lysobacter antibioticus]
MIETPARGAGDGGPPSPRFDHRHNPGARSGFSRPQSRQNCAAARKSSNRPRARADVANATARPRLASAAHGVRPMRGLECAGRVSMRCSASLDALHR